MSRRAALLAALAAAALAAPTASPAQTPAEGDTSAVAFALGELVPNPFQEAVRIPFRLGPPPAERLTGTAPGETPRRDSVRVSVAVYNVLWQRVAWARTWNMARNGGAPVRNRLYAVPGNHEVVWRGRTSGGRRVPSGPYFVELSVDGRTVVRKVLLTR